MTIQEAFLIGKQKGRKLKDSKCISGKRSYISEEVAIESLIQHQVRNSSAATNIYHCEDCGDWHFTSKGRHETLDDTQVIERIKRERLANQWEQKLRY